MNKLDKLFNIKIEEEEEEDDDEITNLPSTVTPTNTNLVPVSEDIDNDAKEDYILSRDTYKQVISQGQSAAKDVHDLAQETDNPRAYEVLATLLKQITDTTFALNQLHNNKTTKNKRDQAIAPNSQISVDKAVFVGTPAEMLQHLNAKTQE